MINEYIMDGVKGKTSAEYACATLGSKSLFYMADVMQVLGNFLVSFNHPAGSKILITSA